MFPALPVLLLLEPPAGGQQKPLEVGCHAQRWMPARAAARLAMSILISILSRAVAVCGGGSLLGLLHQVLQAERECRGLEQWRAHCCCIRISTLSSRSAVRQHAPSGPPRGTVMGPHARMRRKDERAASQRSPRQHRIAHDSLVRLGPPALWRAQVHGGRARSALHAIASVVRTHLLQQEIRFRPQRRRYQRLRFPRELPRCRQRKDIWGAGDTGRADPAAVATLAVPPW